MKPTLKQILDNFGWEKVQQGQLPPEIKSEYEHLSAGVHTWDLYALNGVFAVARDKRVISELVGIAKTSDGYERRGQIPQNYSVKVENVQEFLEGFKHLYSFENHFLFVAEEGMNFNGIGKRIEDAGELYRATQKRKGVKK